MKKKRKKKQADIDDLDTFIFDFKDITLSLFRVHQEHGLPTPSMGDSLYLEELLHDLEAAGVVDSLFAEKLEHIIRYKAKFSFSESMDHDELMEMLEFTNNFKNEYLFGEGIISGKGS